MANMRKGVIKSGLLYYLKGEVKKLHFDDAKHSWRAMVKGKRNNFYYFVDISNLDTSFNAYCDCPSQVQPCKHVAAALIAIEDYQNTGKFNHSTHQVGFLFKNLKRYMSL